MRKEKGERKKPGSAMLSAVSSDLFLLCRAQLARLGLISAFRALNLSLAPSAKVGLTTWSHRVSERFRVCFRLGSKFAGLRAPGGAFVYRSVQVTRRAHRLSSTHTHAERQSQAV